MATYIQYYKLQKYVEGQPVQEFMKGEVVKEDWWPTMESCEQNDQPTWKILNNEFICENDNSSNLWNQYQKLQKYVGGEPYVPEEFMKGEIVSTKEWDTLKECETGKVIPKYCIGWQIMAGGNNGHVIINGTDYLLQNGLYDENGNLIGQSNEGYFCLKTEETITSLQFVGQDLKYINLCNFPTENLTDTSNIFPTNSVIKEIVATEDFLNKLPEYWQDLSVCHLTPCSLNNTFTWRGADTIYYYFNTTATELYATGHSEDLGTASSITSLKFNSAKNSKDTNAITSIDISSLYKKYLTNCNDMFGILNKLESVNLGSLQPISASGMFYQCYVLNNIIYDGFDTSKCEDVSGMFYECRNYDMSICATFDTSKVKYFDAMFYGCDNLVNLNLGNFTADSARNLSKMFINCTKLESLDLSNFNIINASKINQASMFRNCPKLKSIKCKQSFKEMCDTYHTIMGMSTYSSIVWDIVD